MLVAAVGSSCLVAPEREPLDEAELDVLAVEPPPDSVFRPDDDQREIRPPAEELGGRLPGAFPDDFPLPPGVAVVDFGPPTGGEGAAYETMEEVVLRLPMGAPAAREWLLRHGQASGWRVELGDEMTFRRGVRWLRVALEPTVSANRSRARFEYPKP